MAMDHDTAVKIAEEGMNGADDLIEFDKTSLTQLAETLRKSGKRIPNPDANTPEGGTIPCPPYIFGAKSQKRLLKACEIMRF